MAWVLLQLVANVAPILDLPPWIARTILLLLVLGFLSPWYLRGSMDWRPEADR